MHVLLNIPRHERCINCGACCGAIPASYAEIRQIREYLRGNAAARSLAVRQSGDRFKCPFRDDENKKCAIHSVRPIICRLLGVSQGMICRNGNTTEINGADFLRDHTPNNVALLNFEDWKN